MPANTDLTFTDEVRKLEAPCKILLRELAAADAVYLDITDDQDGITDLAWGRILFETTDTQNTTLIMDAVAKTVSCRTGANLFANIRVGRNVQITSFLTAGNNQTTEITAKISNDTIEIGNATGLVSETDTTARAQENPEQFELDKINELQATALALHELYGALTNEITTTADRAALLRDFI